MYLLKNVYVFECTQQGTTKMNVRERKEIIRLPKKREEIFKLAFARKHVCIDVDLFQNAYI